MSSNTAFIVGFMGSGKSSVLDLIKKNTEINTIDLDQAVLEDNTTGVESVEELFNRYGEEYFRIHEVKAFEKIFKNSNTVISLGGGSMTSISIKNTVINSDKSFYLENEFKNLWQNIKESNRPLVATGEDNVKKIYQDRLDIYKQCKNTIDMSKLSLEEASEAIVYQLGWG